MEMKSFRRINTIVIIEGKAQAGDIARKNGFAAIVTPWKICRDR
jgi:hypothetical protein